MQRVTVEEVVRMLNADDHGNTETEQEYLETLYECAKYNNAGEELIITFPNGQTFACLVRQLTGPKEA